MKNDFTFLENVFKLLRSNFQYRCVLSVSQFLSMGFTERKVLMCLDIIRVVRKRHEELARFKRTTEKKQQSVSPSPTDRPKTPPRPSSKKAPVKKSHAFKALDQQRYDQEFQASEEDRSPIATERAGISPTKREDEQPQDSAIRQLNMTIGLLLKRVDEVGSKMEDFIEKTDAKILLMAGKIKLLENSRNRGKPADNSPDSPALYL